MDLKHFIELALRHWHKATGLLFSIVAALLIVSVLLTCVKADGSTGIIVYFIIIISTSGIWHLSNRFPKTQKGKVGFIVSIQCSNEEVHKKIREDFITTLRQLLKGGTLGNTFHFIELPQHLAEQINDCDDALVLRAKTRSHFIIYGRVRLRTLDGKECHILDLEGAVSHRPLPKEASSLLSKEFSELFPRRVSIPKENDLLSFHFTSDWTESVAKYIIGLASAISNDLNYAEKLFTDLQSKLESNETDFPIFIKLKQRLPQRLAEIYRARAHANLTIWRKTHDPKLLANFRSNIIAAGEILSNDYETLLLLSINAFLHGRNVQTSFKYLKKCKNMDDPIWHYNLAFLYAYEGQLYKTIREYRSCMNYKVLAITISHIEDFMVWILGEEPDKYQYYYCLGFFNWKIKGDLQQAAQDFRAFLNVAKDGVFDKEKELAEKWLVEINALMNESAEST